MIGDHDPIELYLDQLVEEMHGPGSEVRRALAEAEDHLRQSESHGIAAGMTQSAAARLAIKTFGAPRVVAEKYSLLRTLASPRQMAAQAFLALVLVGSFIFIGIGVSGIAAAAGAAIYGPGFIAGDAPGVTYTTERCTDFARFHPEAATCEEAAVAHHLDETVETRLGAGVLGLLTLAGWWLLRMATRNGKLGPPTIPQLFVPMATLILFGAAFLFLGGLGILQLVSPGVGSGAGGFISAALVSMLAVVVLGIWVLRNLRHRVDGSSRSI